MPLILLLLAGYNVDGCQHPIDVKMGLEIPEDNNDTTGDGAARLDGVVF